MSPFTLRHLEHPSTFPKGSWDDKHRLLFEYTAKAPAPSFPTVRRSLAARTSQLPEFEQDPPTGTKTIPASVIEFATVVPLVLLVTLLAYAFLLPRYRRKERAAQAAGEAVKVSSAGGEKQIYVGQKTELDATEKDWCELEAGQREVPELTNGPSTQGIGSESTELETAWGIDVRRILTLGMKHELRGEEHTRELGA